EADPQAQFFLSWVWLSKWLEVLEEPWFILAAKLSNHASEYVAFFPLKITINQQDGGDFYTELYMAGNSQSEYTGFICLPGYEEEVTTAFAEYIKQQLTWSAFNLQDILETDKRICLFLKSFSGDSFESSTLCFQNPEDNIDNYICPYIPLADEWDQYLQNSLGTSTRQKIRHLLRKIEGSNEFYITHVNVDNLEHHIEILLKFWQTRWQSSKGAACRVLMERDRDILRHCFANQCLYLPVLWKGDTPIGAIANFIDVSRKAILFYMGSRDETVKNPPPGLVLHAYGIQYAIQNGFKVYDFLRGNEDYKFAFGAKERRIKHIVVKRKNWTSQNRKLD
ncbi:MAG TPA: GNAT family N-acetyltransferase, partial [Candidatus Caenarcaniphilales bacterium]